MLPWGHIAAAKNYAGLWESSIPLFKKNMAYKIFDISEVEALKNNK